MADRTTFYCRASRRPVYHRYRDDITYWLDVVAVDNARVVLGKVTTGEGLTTTVHGHACLRCEARFSKARR